MAPRSALGLALVPLLGLAVACGEAAPEDVPVVRRDGGGASPAEDGGPPGDAGGRDAGVDAGVDAPAVCAGWRAATASVGEGAWDGDADPGACAAGDMDEAWRGRALGLVNAYRALAALPPVELDPVRDAKAQACALMMHANGALSHTPPPSWACFSDDGAEAAGRANVASTAAVASVSLYMVDPGNATTLGHRRWILSNSLGPTGFGSTDAYSCMWTLGGRGAAGRLWTAFPPPGDFPLEAAQLVGLRPFTDLDATGYSIQSDTVDLDAAEVSMTDDGAAFPVEVTALLPGYGSRWAIRLLPEEGRALEAGHTYRVRVSNVAMPDGATAFEYAFRVVDCD